MPSISIITPLFDGIRYLPYFVDSLAAHAPRDAELIFVDDCSSDPVLDIIPNNLPFDRITKLRNEQNRGYSATVNRGFAAARGDIVIQLNSDLILTARAIDSMVSLIERTPHIGIVGSRQVLPTTGTIRHAGMAFGRHSLRHIYAGLPATHPLCTRTRRVQLLSGATVAMSKDVLTEIGPLDERYYNSNENFAHCLKARAAGRTNYLCSTSVVYHWVGQSGPARFAAVTEDDALFWEEWGARREVDLGLFVEEALDHILASHPVLAGYTFDPVSLCRSHDESILLDHVDRHWPGTSARLHRTRAFNSGRTKIWLPMELPLHRLMDPVPYIYLVDRIADLAENHFWFERRDRLVDDELILDARAVAITSRELRELPL